MSQIKPCWWRLLVTQRRRDAEVEGKIRKAASAAAEARALVAAIRSNLDRVESTVRGYSGGAR